MQRMRIRFEDFVSADQLKALHAMRRAQTARAKKAAYERKRRTFVKLSGHTRAGRVIRPIK